MAHASKKSANKPVPLKPKQAASRLSQDEKILGKTLKRETHLSKMNCMQSILGRV